MAAIGEQQIATLKEQIEQARQLKYRYEARLEELQKQRERLLAELQELHVQPDEVATEIDRLRAEVQGLLEEAASLLPPDLPKG